MRELIMIMLAVMFFMLGMIASKMSTHEGTHTIEYQCTEEQKHAAVMDTLVMVLDGGVFVPDYIPPRPRQKPML